MMLSLTESILRISKLRYLFIDSNKVLSSSKSFRANQRKLRLLIFKVFRVLTIIESEASIDSSYFILIGLVLILLLVKLYIVSIKISNPSPMEALVPIHGTPSNKDNFVRSTVIPFLFASSIRFTHTITLLVISIVCNTKLRFLSKQVASTTTMVASGLPKQIKSLATSSSTELAIRE